MLNKKRFNNAVGMGFLLFLGIGGVAHARMIKVNLGWANITPCSRTVWRNDGIFGTPSPTLETAEQRVFAYAYVDAPDANSIKNDIEQCAVQGAAAAGVTAIIASPAGVTAIIASPAGAMPAFQTQFNNCLESRAKSYFTLQLGTSDGQCMW